MNEIDMASCLLHKFFSFIGIVDFVPHWKVQCRINNSSKCCNCYGAHAFGGPVNICVKFVFIICKDVYQNLGARGKFSERAPIFYT